MANMIKGAVDAVSNTLKPPTAVQEKRLITPTFGANINIGGMSNIQHLKQALGLLGNAITAEGFARDVRIETQNATAIEHIKNASTPEELAKARTEDLLAKLPDSPFAIGIGNNPRFNEQLNYVRGQNAASQFEQYYASYQQENNAPATVQDELQQRQEQKKKWYADNVSPELMSDNAFANGAIKNESEAVTRSTTNYMARKTADFKAKQVTQVQSNLSTLASDNITIKTDINSEEFKAFKEQVLQTIVNTKGLNASQLGACVSNMMSIVGERNPAVYATMGELEINIDPTTGKNYKIKEIMPNFEVGKIKANTSAWKLGNEETTKFTAGLSNCKTEAEAREYTKTFITEHPEQQDGAISALTSWHSANKAMAEKLNQRALRTQADVQNGDTSARAILQAIAQQKTSNVPASPGRMAPYDEVEPVKGFDTLQPTTTPSNAFDNPKGRMIATKHEIETTLNKLIKATDDNERKEVVKDFLSGYLPNLQTEYKNILNDVPDRVRMGLSATEGTQAMDAFKMTYAIYKSGDARARELINKDNWDMYNTVDMLLRSNGGNYEEALKEYQQGITQRNNPDFQAQKREKMRALGFDPILDITQQGIQQATGYKLNFDRLPVYVSSEGGLISTGKSATNIKANADPNVQDTFMKACSAYLDIHGLNVSRDDVLKWATQTVNNQYIAFNWNDSGIRRNADSNALFGLEPSNMGFVDKSILNESMEGVADKADVFSAYMKHYVKQIAYENNLSNDAISGRIKVNVLDNNDNIEIMLNEKSYKKIPLATMCQQAVEFSKTKDYIQGSGAFKGSPEASGWDILKFIR